MSSDNIRKNRNKKIEEKKYVFKERLTDILELPKEIILDLTKITMLVNKSILIENYKGILHYDSKLIRINTTNNQILIEGCDLLIKEITKEEVVIDGNIKSVELI